MFISVYQLKLSANFFIKCQGSSNSSIFFNDDPKNTHLKYSGVFCYWVTGHFMTILNQKNEENGQLLRKKKKTRSELGNLWCSKTWGVLYVIYVLYVLYVHEYINLNCWAIWEWFPLLTFKKKHDFQWGRTVRSQHNWPIMY